MEDPTPIIERSELVTDHFGYWPSFHDAELERLVLSTGNPERESVHLEAALHAFEMTSEVDERGYYVLRKHCRVRFRFERVLEVAVEGFDNQNSLHEAAFTDVRSDQLEGIVARVRFVGHGTGDVSFSCGRIAVLDLAPTDGRGRHPFGGGWGPPIGEP